MNRLAIVTRLLKPTLFIAGLVPVAWLALAAGSDGLGANPIETITHETGLWTLRCLLVTLAVTPVARLTGWHELVRLRRMTGLFGFFYALLHFATWAWLDQALAWSDMLEDVLKRPYITVGFATLLMLLPLALTSNRAMQRRLGGRRWKRLHQLAYLCGLGGCLHYLWLVKADTLAPLLYLSTYALLMVARLPQARSGRTAGA